MCKADDLMQSNKRYVLTISSRVYSLILLWVTLFILQNVKEMCTLYVVFNKN